jgi:Rieske Fe-S protein
MATARVVTTQAESQTGDKKPSRREFLYYVWGASMALLVGEAAAGIAWFTSNRLNSSEMISLNLDVFPETGFAIRIPTPNWNRRLSFAHTDNDTFIALDPTCTHLGCETKWVPLNHRYECPCHASNFELDGTYISGLALRSLDRYRMTIAFTDGTTVTTNDAGDPIPVNGREIASVTVDTRRLIEREGRV